MPYSLINQFRGALMGAAIGEILGLNCQHPQAWREVEHWGLRLPAQTSAWGKRAIEQAQALIHGKNRSPLSLDSENTIEAEQAMIALLPIALFYHEDVARLKAHLSAALIDSPQLIDRCGQMGAAIALTLQQKSSPAEPSHDFRLTLLQTAKTAPGQCPIVGAQAGAAYGLTGIPASWRHRLNRAGYASVLGLASEAEAVQIADDLLAAWAGIYHPTRRQVNPVVAAPRIIRRD
jgi:hypothetical protein